jgi:hypothetical protein
MRKIKEVLRLKFAVAWGSGRSPAVARLVSEPYKSICNEPKLPASRGRLVRIGTKTGWRLPCSAVHHGFARPYCRCPILPTFTSSGSGILT